MNIYKVQTRKTMLLLFAALLLLPRQGDTRPAPEGVVPVHDTNDRVLVMSGGGARGAWGVGVLDGLFEKSSVRYSAVFGTSTGSLMAPLVLVQDMPRLIEAYTGVRQENIFNVNPFKIRTVNGEVKADIKMVNAVLRLLFKKNTLGETYPLRERIKQYFVKADYDHIVQGGKSMHIAVTNMYTGKVELKSSDRYSYQEMCNWIWASANEPVWMSYFKKGDSLYVDGGVRDVIPLRQAIRWAFKNHYQRLDVIVNNSEDFLETFPPENSMNFSWLKTLVRTLEVYNAGTVHNDVAVGRLMEEVHKLQLACPSAAGEATKAIGVPLKVTIRFMPKALAAKYRAELAFFAEPMKYLMEQGKASIRKDALKTIEFNITNNTATQQALE